MVLDKLGSALKETLKKVARAVFVDEKLINELIKDIQRALLAADVNVQLVFELSNKIKERALNEKFPENVSQKEYLIKIVYEELVKFLGEERKEIKIEKKLFKILMIGLYGSGKTTSIGKLAKYYSKRGYKVATIGLDVHRPAAPQQLKQVSDQVNVKSFIDKGDPIEIYEKHEKELRNYDVVLIDTAGRDALNDDLIREIKKINDKVKADERLLVISADIGQAAENQARKFHETCNITGILISKLDGTAKGGGALIASSVSGAPVKFIGIGEKVDDLEIFNPKGFVGRLLGMGDLEGLLEKVKDEISLESAEDLGKRMLKGDYNFLDLYEQMQSMQKLGPLNKVIEMIPGLGSSIPKEMLDVQEDKLKKWKFMMQSMTKEELENPELLSISRIERIAKGSGVNTSEVRDLLKQYKQSKKMVKMMKGKDPSKLLKKFKIPGMK